MIPKKKLPMRGLYVMTVLFFIFSVCAFENVPALSVALSVTGGCDTPVSGPTSGSLEHKDDGTIKYYPADVDVKDFVADVTFYNPYSTAKGSWDYGFLFRRVESGTFHTIRVTPGGKWYHDVVINGDWNRVGEGEVSLQTGANQKNHMRLIVIGDSGWFYVNGQLVATLDTSRLTKSGDVCAATGTFSGNEIEGEATRFKDFTVWSFDEPTSGPTSGSLEHEVDEYIEVYSADVNVKDFVVEAVFYNPYSTAKGSWDYGFLFRRSEAGISHVIRVRSDGMWKHSVTTENEWNTVGEGNVSGLRTGATQSNHLRVIVMGDSGWFYVNDQFVTGLDTSELTKKGDISAATGVSGGDEIDGEATRFEDFTVWSLDGCPALPVYEPGDRDKDGVTDDRDDCYNPGCTLVDSQGCPYDSDGDGVNNCDDHCKYSKGPASNNGCPVDKDDDGITDDHDDCYNPGCKIVDSRGCPKDSDGDGVSDCEDDCPSEPGKYSFQGCPDTDTDGVPDPEDDCDNPGCKIVDSHGCPKDSDSDGVSDCDDECPSEYGERENGCPTSPLLYVIPALGAIVVVGIVVQKKRHKTEEGKTEVKVKVKEKIEEKPKEELKKTEVKKEAKEEKPKEELKKTEVKKEAKEEKPREKLKKTEVKKEAKEEKPKEELKKTEVKEKIKEEKKIEKEQPKVVPVPLVTEKKCPSCGNKVKPDDVYCAKCGKNLTKPESKTIICPFCKNEIEEHWVSCPHCGTKLTDDTKIY